MDSKKQILSYIERTNSLLKSSAKTLAGESLFSGTTSIKKAKKVKTKPIPQDLIRSITAHPRFSSPGRINSPSRSGTWATSNTEFVKKVNNALSELSQTSSFKKKKNLEMATKEEKILKDLALLVKNQKQSIKLEYSTEKDPKREQLLQSFMQNSAEELLALEKKCKSIVNDNIELKKSLEDAKPFERLSISEIIKKILAKNSGKAEVEEKLKLDKVIDKDYSQTIELIVLEWVNLIDFEKILEVSANLVFSLETERSLLSCSQEELNRKFDSIKSQRTQLEAQINKYEN